MFNRPLTLSTPSLVAAGFVWASGLTEKCTDEDVHVCFVILFIYFTCKSTAEPIFALNLSNNASPDEPKICKSQLI